MKLKKVVSLAAAALMAVSMLAGCSTTPATPDDGKEEVVSLSAEIGKMLDAPEYVKFADSAELTAGLEKAVEYAGVLDVMPQYVTYDELVAVDSLKEKMGLPDNATVETIGSQSTLANIEQWSDGYTVEGATATDMYVVSGAIGENAVKAQIAEKLKAVEGYSYSVVENGTVGGNFNYNYTVSVSTCTKTVNSSVAGFIGTGVGAENPTVTFVAIQVVRTGTHQ